MVGRSKSSVSSESQIFTIQTAERLALRQGRVGGLTVTCHFSVGRGTGCSPAVAAHSRAGCSRVGTMSLWQAS